MYLFLWRPCSSRPLTFDDFAVPIFPSIVFQFSGIDFIRINYAGHLDFLNFRFPINAYCPSFSATSPVTLMISHPYSMPMKMI